MAADCEDSSSENGYRFRPPEIRKIADALPGPTQLSFHHRWDRIFSLQGRSLPPLADLAKPEEKLAGLHIDGECNSLSRMEYYTSIGMCQLLNDGTMGPENEVYGLPSGAKISSLKWSKDGSYIAFNVRTDEEDGCSGKLRLWVVEVETREARPLFQTPDILLNAVFEHFVWVNSSTLLVCTIPPSRKDPPKKRLVPSGPTIQSNERGDIIRAITYQYLLKDEYDEALFDYYATSQLVMVSLDGTVKHFGTPAIHTCFKPSPDGKYIMVYSMQKPYSFILPFQRFPLKVDLWTADGTYIRELCDNPLDEDIPIGNDSARRGKRSITWRADKPSTMVWVETQDMGHANIKVSPRDIVYTEPAEPLENDQPVVLHKLDNRFGEIIWCDDSLALLYESWSKTRNKKTWVISPDCEGVSPRILFDRSSEDDYSDPGSPLLRRTTLGSFVIAKIKKEDDESTYILLKGRGATPQGNVPFLDLFDIDTGRRERIWESDRDKYYETVIALLCDLGQEEIPLNQLKVLTSKESHAENKQYCIVSWPEKRARQITNYPHPYPHLSPLKKEMIVYQRDDGFQLTATLYLPHDYDPARYEPLPCLMWSYPSSFLSKDMAGQVRGSPNKFTAIDSTSPLFWLTRRFAVFLVPTITFGGVANQSYEEQLVASAKAAVNEIIRRGVAHPKKIAFGGQSYGACLTGVLLAREPDLFCCGIALSGAYNRTLTPFGFQVVQGTFWEVPRVYSAMSPFLSADIIKKPMLLIHGEEDENAGTLTMQSERFFSALRGNGVPCRLVLLPFEGHTYVSRESVMHTLWEIDRWLRLHCVDIDL